MAPIKNSNTPKGYNKSPQDVQTLKLFLVLFFLTVVLFAGIQAFINFQSLKVRQPNNVINTVNPPEVQNLNSINSESH